MARKARGPKRIAGVRVPKRMRRSLGRAVHVLQNPLVAELAVAALLAAAAAIRDNTKVRTAARRAKDKTIDAAHGIETGMASIASVVAAGAREAAETLGHSDQRVGATNGGGAAHAGGKTRGKAKKSRAAVSR